MQMLLLFIIKIWTVVIIYFFMGQKYSLQNQMGVKIISFPKQVTLQLSIGKVTSCKILDIFFNLC